MKKIQTYLTNSKNQLTEELTDELTKHSVDFDGDGTVDGTEGIPNTDYMIDHLL
jgi:hypothetical protein